MTAQVATGRRSVAELKALVAQAQADSADWTADDVAAWTAAHFAGRVAVACSMAGVTMRGCCAMPLLLCARSRGSRPISAV